MDAAELARQFDLGAAATLSDGPVARGRQGVVWRLDTSDGSWAVKVPFDAPDEDEVATSTLFQEAAYSAGVPTPQVRRTTQGCVFAGPPGARARVYEWVDLCAGDRRLDPELVGRTVAAMHVVSVPFEGAVDPWYTEPVGPDRWDRLVSQLFAADAPFAHRLAGLRDELVALESWIAPPERTMICHCDLWVDNLLPTPDGGVCVIDWENSGPADPSQELGCVLFEFARGDPGRARALVRAYRGVGGPATVRRRGDFTMLIAQLGHITEIAGQDWLEPNQRTPDRATAAAWIGEVLDEPHTRNLLDELLAAVEGCG
jgi:aminoglycoside phosphotransferase (APT) family kinase protein